MIKKISIIFCIIIVFYVLITNFKGVGSHNYGLSEQTIITTADTLGFNNYPYNDTYAGTWYENGILKTGTTKWFATGNNVTQKFSYNELIKLYIFIYSIKDNYSVVSIGVSQQSNYVSIIVEDKLDILKIKMLILYRSGFGTSLVLKGLHFEVGTIEVI